MLKNLFYGFINLLYPSRCHICRCFSEEPICPACLSSFYLCHPPLCSKCGKPCHLVVDQCRECRGKSFVFDLARAVGLYQGNLRLAIHKFKYNNSRNLAKVFARLAMKVLANQSSFWDVDLVSYVPLTRKKETKRGYNQAQIFGQEVSSLIGKPNLSTLVCLREIEDQSKLDFSTRQKNVKGAFSLKRGTQIKDKDILLVDDVFTTGFTLNECTKALLGSGAKRVNVFTIARATLLT